MAASTQVKPWEAEWNSLSPYCGFVHSTEEIAKIKISFEVHSSLSFVLGKKDAIFGTGAGKTGGRTRLSFDSPVTLYNSTINTTEELSYKTRSTSRSINTLLYVVMLQRTSSTRQGAPAGVYLPCCV